MDTVQNTRDWRAQMQRRRIVNKIMDILERNLPFSGYKEQQVLRKIAERVEEEIYTAATNQSEYSRKICFMMLSIETRLQNPPKPLHWREEVYRKIKAMKDLYLPELNDMHQRIVSKLSERESLPPQPKIEHQLEKLKVFKNMLERFMQFLQIPKHGILANYKDKLGTYEKQIIAIINSNKRKPAPPQQPALPPQHMQSLQQSQQTHPQYAPSDWREEVYQKINDMKELYLLELKHTQGASGTVGDC